MLLLLFCAALAAGADDKAAEKSKRIAYLVKHGSAKDLAKVLGEHLKGAADVQMLPEASANVLLIRATPAAFPEVLKLLEALDRRPRLVAVEVWVAEVLAGDKKDEPLDTKQLNGPADDVPAKVEELRTKGRIGELKRLELTTAENQSARAFLGQNPPIVLESTSRRGAASAATSLTAPWAWAPALRRAWARTTSSPWSCAWMTRGPVSIPTLPSSAKLRIRPRCGRLRWSKRPPRAR